MSTKPRLSILIATLGQREVRFQRLLKRLIPQAKETEILVYWNNFERPLPEIRQALVKEARGDYVCFIDDDDMVPTYYVAEILKATQNNPDYVGWRMQLYMNGEKVKPTFHSLKYDRWDEDENGYYRNISHLNPIKRELALKENFIVPEGIPEDYDWAKRMVQHVKTEQYIDRVMYHYYPSAEDSLWRGGRELRTLYRPIIRSKCFRWHPESKESWEPQA